MIEVLLVVSLVALVGLWLRPVAAPRAVTVTEATAERGDVGRRSAPGAGGRRFRRNATIDPAELAGWCDALARAVRGGSTLHHAFVSVAGPASVAPNLDPALLTLSRGSSLSAALSQVERGSPHLDLVIVVLHACALHGGAPAEPIDRAATALRQRASLAFERRTQSAQAKASAIVMTALPGALLGVLLLTSGATRSAVCSPPGLSSVAAGVLCNATGWAWMRRVIGGR